MLLYSIVYNNLPRDPRLVSSLLAKASRGLRLETLDEDTKTMPLVGKCSTNQFPLGLTASKVAWYVQSPTLQLYRVSSVLIKKYSNV